MAIDKAVDSTALDSALTYTADRIRVKTGDTAQIAWDNDKGFGDAVDAISGGGAQTSDPREVYQGTRPAEWLRLPDYDEVEENCIYALCEIPPDTTSKLRFRTRADTGTYVTISEGLVENGAFDEMHSAQYKSPNGSTSFTIDLNYEFSDFSWAKMLSNGNKQFVLRVKADSPRRTLRIANLYSYYCPCIIKDLIYNYSASEVEAGDEYIYGIKYLHVKAGALWRNCRMYGLEYVQVNPSATDNPLDNLTSPQVRQFVNTIIKRSTFPGDMILLEKAIIDASLVTSTSVMGTGNWRSLKEIEFVNYESLTSFPANINLTNSNLSVQAVADFFDTLPDISTSDTSRTITLKNTPAASEGIPDDTLAVATNKGWTVVTA